MQILENFNWIDILLILLLIKTVYSGARAGLTAELFRTIGTIISIIVGLHYYNEIAADLSTYVKAPVWLLQVIILAAIIILASIIFRYAVILLLKILNIQFIQHIEKIGGALLGLARGFLAGGLLLIILLLLPAEYLTTSISEKSFLSPCFITATEKTYSFIIGLIPSQKPKELAVPSAAEQAKPAQKK